MIKKKDITAGGITEYFNRNYPGNTDMVRPVDPVQVKLCRRFIRKHLKPHRRGHSSYHYKHVVERYYDKYISNGAFITAAILEECKIERIRMGPNVRVFMSFKDKNVAKKCNSYI